MEGFRFRRASAQFSLSIVLGWTRQNGGQLSLCLWFGFQKKGVPSKTDEPPRYF